MAWVKHGRSSQAYGPGAGPRLCVRCNGIAINAFIIRAEPGAKRATLYFDDAKKRVGVRLHRGSGDSDSYTLTDDSNRRGVRAGVIVQVHGLHKHHPWLPAAPASLPAKKRGGIWFIECRK